MADELAALDRQIADAQDVHAAAPDLRAMCERFAHTSVTTIVDALVAQGNDAALRDLVLSLVESATIAERVPQKRARWARASVVWNADVRTLIDAGLCTLAPGAGLV